MTDWLLDTNVISELRKPRPNSQVLAFIAQQPLSTLFVSTVSFAEIRFGIDLLANSSNRSALTDWFEQDVRPLFDRRVLDVSENIMFRWRQLVEQGRKTGHTFSQPDLIIAATALEHNLTLVTRDQGDYKKSGVALFDPWNFRA